ncbi:MAG: hypothetical protein V4655_01210 [Bdellovibrionota bacterium]|nr:MAG: hypothetical protein EOP10_16495 [Pseudomonadota bacterium]
MLKKSLLSAAFVLGTVASTSAFSQAADFTSADALFAIRDQGADGGLANTLAARAAYQAIVSAGATQADLTRAIEGVARTYYFQGEVLIGKSTDAEKKARKAVWNECWKKAVEPLSPANFGSLNPVYFYFRASCMAHEAEVSTVVERVVQLPTLLKTFSDGNKQTTEQLAYEGGGLARVQAAINGNIEAKPLGIFKPEEALALVDSSIVSSGYSVNPEAAATSGDFFCENFYRKATILSVYEQVPAALELANQTVADFTAYLSEEGIIPESIRAETQHCVKQVTEFAAGLSS